MRITTRLLLPAAAAALLVSGCGGPGRGDKYKISGGTIYFDKADAGRGGAPNKDLDLAIEHKAAFSSSVVEIIEPGPQWTKIKTVNGDHPGTEGWIDSAVIKEGHPYDPAVE